jgi:cobalamin-dependent methionine synthase I
MTMMSESTIVRAWQLNIDVDSVLRGQGADAAIIRQRRPRLIEIAERAIQEGSTLIDLAAVYRLMPVASVRHEVMTLADGSQLTGSLVARQLAAAQQVALIVCTIGDALDRRMAALMWTDPAYALALDGYGSAAVEALGEAICAQLEEEAARQGQCTSVPLSPGMIGWPVEVGQPQIFSLLETEDIGVTLNDSVQMIPRKSSSMILGLSRTPFGEGRPCDFCAQRATCRYQDQYQRKAKM